METKKKINNIFIGLIQLVRKKYVTITRQPFEVSKEWFEALHTKHFTSEVHSKYVPKLYEEQGLAEALMDQITISPERRNHVLEELDNLKHSFANFEQFYSRLKRVLQDENIKVNSDSDLHQFLEQFNLAVTSLSQVLGEYHEILTSGSIDEINKLDKVENDTINKDVDFQVTRLKEYNYIDKFPSSIIEISSLFEFIDNVRYYLKEVNNLIDPIRDKHFLIAGSAGIGKSNLTARLTLELNAKHQPVIFLQAKSFSGETTNFEETFSRLLAIPAGYGHAEVLAKLNSYGELKSKRVTIIIDALNETTFTNSGFSTIWALHLNNYLHSLKSYPWLFFIGTLRLSYVERVWPKITPEKLIILKGFGDAQLTEAVAKYFDYYKIEYPDAYTERDLYLFRTPLLLSLFCQMLNPKRLNTVKATLGFKGYASVFDKYIEELSIDIKAEMQLASKDLVKMAISRCSDAFLEHLDASLPILNYYEAIEDKKLEANFSQNHSIAFRILEEYLIYIRDSINASDSELVFHSYQEVGGYLLAQRLLEKYSNIQGVMDSDFFKDYIIGDKDGGHQLRDDILEFLTVTSIDYVPYLTKYIKDDRVRKFVLLKLQREVKAKTNSALRTKLIESFSKNNDYQLLLDASTSFLTIPDSPLRIIRLSQEILKHKGLDFDMIWTKFVYQNAVVFTQEMEKFLDEAKGYGENVEFDEAIELKLELAILLLESTVRSLRDLATKVLIEYGVLFPEKLFENLYKYSETTKVYIYERLASISYGICLRRQNDSLFVKFHLAPNAKRIYNLQFAEKPLKSTYNYIVIDSYKHLLDLAIQKGVFELDDANKIKLKAYLFTPPENWSQPSNQDIETVREIAADSYHTEGPDPLSMDFVIYTISRLLKSERDEKWENKLAAVANIYRRILDLGYQTLKFEDRNGRDSSFFYGVKSPRIDGKVDRLGKKYSWMAYFDYAGYLLNQGELDVWYPENDGTDGEYQRLSDIHVEVSNTLALSAEKKRLYYHPMFGERGTTKDWASKTLYHTTKELWDQVFDDKEYTLINGKVEEKLGKSYETRTYLLLEAYLVKRKDIEGKEHLIVGREFDWNDDIRFHITQTKTYFGELYWADNISNVTSNTEQFPLEETEEIEFKLDYRDIISDEKYKGMKLGEIVKEEQPKQLLVEAEPATIEYLWESESSVFPSLNRDIPSPNIGKHLLLRADTSRFTFLDTESELATKYFDFEDSSIDQDFTYIRTDLLRKYLEDMDLILMYQIKQHTYDNVTDSDTGSNFRGMQFFFPHLK